MGDIFNNIVIFLEDYYLYVVGAGLIIILMLIGFLSSKSKERKAKVQEEPSINIKDVNIDSPSSVISPLPENTIKPVDVVSFSAPEIEPVDEIKTIEEPVFTPIRIEEEAVDSMTKETPVFAMSSDSTDINFATIETPVLEEIKPLELEPTKEEDLDKTEVFDFSISSEPSAPVEKPFVVDNSTKDNTILTDGKIEFEKPKIQ